MQDLVGVLRAQTQGDVPLWRVNPWGDIIFGDSFEGNEIHWYQVIVLGATITREYRERYVYHQNASVRADIPGVANTEAAIHHYFSIPTDISGVGFEFAFLTNTVNAEHRISATVFYYDGVTLWSGSVIYRPNLSRVDVVGTTTINIFPAINRTHLVWQKCKMTLDFTNNTFKNVIFNDTQINASSVALTAAASAVEPCLLFQLRFYGSAANVTAGTCWFDDFLLTIKEPQLP